jgi:parallel beta-helix repeat protein/predicted outer membrane repeat protein
VIFLCLITAIFCLFSAGRTAFAAEIVDQSNLPEWAGGWTHINPDPNGQARMWQTFKPDYSNITAVEIDILTVNAGDFNDIITVEITKDGKVLASTERNVEYGFEGLLRFEFDEAIDIVPGELYELKVHDTGLTRFGWKYASNAYDRGSRYVSAIDHPGTDWFFRTYSLELRIIYVDDDAAGTNDGTSWENAYTFLQDALIDADDAEKPVEIRVAQGTYKPNQGIFPIIPAGVGGRTNEPYPAKYPADLGNKASFNLINDVTIKGGYAGLTEPDPNTRNIGLYETILSGDLNGDDIDVNDPCDLRNEPTRIDNSNRIVNASGTDATTVLDGFTITAGFGPFGAGMGNDHGSPILISCTFKGNTAYHDYGGGLLNSSGNPTLINCTFTKNYGELGGGMCNISSSPILTNCRFTNNYAEFGAGMYNMHSPPKVHSTRDSNSTLIDCTFDDNNAGLWGGGMFNERSDSNLSNCAFNRNNARGMGAGMFNTESELAMTDCTFSENTGGSGGGIYSEDNSSLILTKCTFRDNVAEVVFGGGICNEDANEIILANCTFSGNTAKRDGGGIFNRRSSSTLTNCIFNGNKAYGESTNTGKGGGLYAFGDARLNNCTFSGNWAQQGLAIFKYSLSDLRLIDCILWDGGNEVIQTGIRPNIIYSNIQGDWEGEGNIEEDPLFVNPGYWADADDPNIVVGPNDPNAVWVDGDYHLKSQAGRWDPVSQSWIFDDVTSPCIDAGDPNSPVGNEPAPNGGRINMGAYGGTAEASKSFTSELFQASQELIRVYGSKYGK